MYSQLLFFIVALLIFTVQQPGTQPFLPPLLTSLYGIGSFAAYVATCRGIFNRLGRSMLSGMPQSSLSLSYYRAQTRLSILALMLLAADVYLLNIKFYLQQIPGFAESLTLSGFIGLVLYIMHVGVIWFYSHPIYQKIHQSNISRTAFVRGHLAFNSAILFPWLLISLFSDIFQIVKLPVFLRSDTGQFLLFGLVMGMFILFGPRLVVRLWGCDPLPPSMVRKELEMFCEQHSFRVGNLLTWPLFGGETLTAGVMGILPTWRYILITKGLLSLLNFEELKAVVAHEMGHVRRYHLFLYLVFFLCYTALAYSLSDIIMLLYLKHSMLLQWALTDDSMYLTMFSLVSNLPILLLLIVYFRYIFGFFMRNSERQADLYALQLVGHPYTLISSLEKIALYSGQIYDLPSWHHYSIRQRVNFLMDSYRNPALIRKHNIKLYGTAIIFMLFIGAAVIAGSYVEKANFARKWRLEVETNLLERELHRQPGEAKLYAAYGGILLELGKTGQAESALKKALSLAPENPGVLNNLAWLYATSPSPYYSPQAALSLASQAASIDPQPYVLDTLAEAYLINGRFKDALATIEKAISSKPNNLKYFLDQKKKFEEALRNQSGK